MGNYIIDINVNEDVASEFRKHELYSNPYSSFELNVISFSVMEQIKECLSNLQKQIEKSKLMRKRVKKAHM
jgi:hypothetical protein